MTEEAKITATLVPENQRMDFLPSTFGKPGLKYMLIGETMVYAHMDRLCESYGGGLWAFYRLSNGGFYMAPQRQGNMRLVHAENYFEGEMSPDAAGIVATLFALNGLAWKTRVDYFSDVYHLLLDYANQHPEAGVIGAAID